MKFKVKNGLSYPVQGGDEVRREIGEIVDDIPVNSVGWLLEQGHIEEYIGEVEPAPTPAPEVEIVEVVEVVEVIDEEQEADEQAEEGGE